MNTENTYHVFEYDSQSEILNGANDGRDDGFSEGTTEGNNEG